MVTSQEIAVIRTALLKSLSLAKEQVEKLEIAIARCNQCYEAILILEECNVCETSS